MPKVDKREKKKGEKMAEYKNHSFYNGKKVYIYKQIRKFIENKKRKKQDRKEERKMKKKIKEKKISEA